MKLIGIFLFFSLGSLIAFPMDPEKNFIENETESRDGSSATREFAHRGETDAADHLLDGRSTPTAHNNANRLSLTPNRMRNFVGWCSISREQQENALLSNTSGREERGGYYQQLINAYEKSSEVIELAYQQDQELSSDLAVIRTKEYEALAELWRNAGWGASCVLNEKNQLRQLRHQDPLNQEAITKSEQAVENRKKTVKYLQQGADTMHQLLHFLWVDHKKITIANLANENSPLPHGEMEGHTSYLKEESYRNNVASFQLLAADCVEDEDREVASLLEEIADRQYDQMNSENNLIKENDGLLALCSQLSDLRKKTVHKEGAHKLDEEKAQVAEVIAQIKSLIAEEGEENEGIFSFQPPAVRKRVLSKNKKPDAF